MQNSRVRVKEINRVLAALKEGQPLQPTKSERFIEKDYQPGLSIIIPMYKSAPFIERLVNSLIHVISESVPYEVVFVLNGTEETVALDQDLLEKALSSSRLNYSILLSEQGAGKARNAGIKAARYSHSLLLDSDDTLSPGIIDQLEPYLSPTAITVFEIHDIHTESDSGSNVIQEEVKPFFGQTTTEYFKIMKILSMNGAKVIPSSYLLNTLYDENLRSGEDIVLMMSIITKFMPEVIIVPEHTAVYHRYIVDNSVSRVAMSYDFNVQQRFEVIRLLGDLADEADAEIRQLILNRMDAQAGFVSRYLMVHPEDYSRVIQLFQTLDCDYIPYGAINRNNVRTLYIGYCFTPYADTSGIVLAKRIRERCQPCDVISNDMSAVRTVDYTLNQIAEPFIYQHFELPTKPSFSSWSVIESFVTLGERKVKDRKYDEIYSRVLWPGSHFLAFKLKMQRPEIKWTAEFSDPVLHDIKNNEREAPLHSKQLHKLFGKIDKRWKSYIDSNLFNMTEIIAFAEADEIIFTNYSQMFSMCERFKEPELRQIITEKAVIKTHPVAEPSFYQLEQSLIQLDQDYFHIGYFGNFYETRGLQEIISLIREPEQVAALNPKSLPLKLHIFTSNPKQSKMELRKHGLGRSVEVYPYLPYLEFLNMTTHLDALLVMDAHTKEYKRINPYLPSKLSDYLGSNTPIIAFTERDSPMSRLKDANLLKIEL
ncbi:glycosyltransferase [Macrococcus equipercicus]|uniref:Glycosyltransferase n=1 Tax=Macrococcus equipercicus TaxID=69967 RepID=A0A9Q9BNR8_9STAP|nr:glycosyltransferase [Macrococcus equipercicus]UTH14495.1 glycosyltransferase [Macrococcus equipercicus]